VFFQQTVDVGRLASRVQGFIDGAPVRAIVLRGAIPFRVVARRQAERLVARCDWRWRETFLFIAGFNEGPQMAIVVAVIDCGVGEIDLGELVARLAAARDITECEIGDGRR
jgi:hypothetical protein